MERTPVTFCLYQWINKMNEGACLVHKPFNWRQMWSVDVLVEVKAKCDVWNTFLLFALTLKQLILYNLSWYHTDLLPVNTFVYYHWGFLNATFNNISVILWRSVLLAEETEVPGENHRPVASHWQSLRKPPKKTA